MGIIPLRSFPCPLYNASELWNLCLSDGSVKGIRGGNLLGLCVRIVLAKRLFGCYARRLELTHVFVGELTYRNERRVMTHIPDHMQAETRKPKMSGLFWPCVVVATASLFYLYEYFLRVSPSVMTHELMRDFHVGAVGLGMVGAAFFLGYIPMQIPAGLLADKLGPRKLITVAVCLCAASSLLFAAAHGVYTAALARFLMGMAASFAFVCPLLLTSRWFAPKYFALITGLVQVIGCVGAIAGGAPVAMLVAELGWRTTLVYAAIVGCLLGALCWLIVRDRPPSAVETTTPKTVARLTEKQRLVLVMKNRQTWWYALVAFCVWAPIVIFGDGAGRKCDSYLKSGSPVACNSCLKWAPSPS